MPICSVYGNVNQKTNCELIDGVKLQTALLHVDYGVNY